jgi:hypothetical protein
MRWVVLKSLACLAVLASAVTASAAVQSISLNATANGSSRYYEYDSDAYVQMDYIHADGVRQRFHGISNPATEYGGDMFPNDYAWRFGTASYDDAGLVSGSGTVPITGLNLGFLTDPTASSFLNIARFGTNNETTTLGAWSGSATFAGGVLTSLNLNVPVTITTSLGLFVGSPLVFTGNFNVSGRNFSLLADAPVPTDLTPPFDPFGRFDFTGTINAVAVPEPSALILAGLALAGGVGYLRRKPAAA